MKRDDLTAHGFRATFKTWASERTSFQNEIVEAALAHVVGNKVEQAYRRGDMMENRRRLMTDWSDYCEQTLACSPKSKPSLRSESGYFHALGRRHGHGAEGQVD